MKPKTSPPKQDPVVAPCDIPGESVKTMRKSILVVWAALGTALSAFSQAAPPATPQQTPRLDYRLRRIGRSQRRALSGAFRVRPRPRVPAPGRQPTKGI